MYKQTMEKFGATLWIFIAAVLLSLLMMLTVGFDLDAYSDWVSSVVVTILIIIMLAGAISIRYLFNRKNLDLDTAPKSWLFVWLIPLAITLVMLPWLLSGVLSDESTSIGMSIFLWSILAIGSLLLGFLLVPFVVVPLELIGTGLLRIFSGNHKEGLPLILIGGYIGLITAFSIVGGLALTDVPTAQAGWPHIIFALLGLPGVYEVESQALLWVARVLAILLIAIPLAFYMPERRRQRQSARKTRSRS